MTTRLASSPLMALFTNPGASVLRAVVLCAAATFGLTASAADPIRGAGATFPAPVYNAWATAYEQSNGVQISYEAVGSGAGIERIRQRQVDFGASDAPLTSEDLNRSQLLQFPVVVGGVVPVINISGIKPGQLKLTGPLLAQIYLGHIKKWNDAATGAGIGLRSGAAYSRRSAPGSLERAARQLRKAFMARGSLSQTCHR